MARRTKKESTRLPVKKSESRVTNDPRCQLTKELEDAICELYAAYKNLTQVAIILGLNPVTVKTWKQRYPGFRLRLITKEALNNIDVEKSQLKLATGHKQLIKEQKVTKDGDVVELTREVYTPPNATAQIFYLKNRLPQRWSDKVEVESVSEHRIVLDTGTAVRKLPV